MKRKLLSLILSICLIVSCAPPISAEDAVTGFVSDNVKFTFENNVLTFELIENPVSTVSRELPASAVSKTGINTDTIKSIIVKDGITGIGNYAFSSCKKAMTIELPKKIEHLGWSVFAYCSSLTSITIPEGATVLDDYTFSDCTMLALVNLPSTLNKINQTAFLRCSGISSITVSEENPNYISEDGVLYTTGKATLVKFPPKKPVTAKTYIIPAETTRIEDYAFWKCYYLESIIISEGSLPLSIGKSAFDLSNIYTYHLPRRLSKIGQFAFDNGNKYFFDSSRLHIYYSGTSEDWMKIALPSYMYEWSDENSPLLQNEMGFFTRAIFYHIDNAGEDTSAAEEMVWLKYAPGDGKYTYFTMPPYPTPVRVGEEFTIPGLLSSGDTNKYTFAPPTGGSFTGWEIDGEFYRPGDKYTVTGEATLTAVWFDPSNATVTLEPNGGTVSPASISVTDKAAYGILPTPTRTGYSFTGWFTEMDGDNQITADTIFTKDSGATTLYAHWEAIPSYSINFDPNGGTVGTTVKTVYKGENYGALPIPEREDYTFDGWFTSAEGGTLITAQTQFTANTDQTLYAHWTEKPIIYTVTYDANGGKILTGSGERDSFSQTFSSGAKYAPSYTPYRAGYSFAGWYTAQEGGQRVLPGDAIPDRDHTVYARWLEMPCTDIFDALHFGFINTHDDFGYPSDYRIPYIRYKTVYGDNARARGLYKGQGVWGGNCYGVAASAILYYVANNGVNPIDFKGTSADQFSETTGGLNINWRRTLDGEAFTVRGLIECMQVSAIDACVWDFETIRTQAQYKELIDAVKAVKDGAPPVNINAYNVSVGHAVVGYAFAEVDDREDRIYVYDGNNKDAPGYITLNKDAAGNYTGWHYGKYNFVMVVNYYENIRRAANFIPISEIIAQADNSNYLLMQTNTRNAKIYNESGNLVGELKNGILENDSGLRQSKQLDAVEGEAGGASAILWLPKGAYTVENQDDSLAKLEVCVLDIEQSAAVDTASNTVSFWVDDAPAGGQPVNYISAGVIPEGTDYQITLESTLGDEYEQIVLTGKGSGSSSDNVTVAKWGAELYTDGVKLESSEIELKTLDTPEVYNDYSEDSSGALIAPTPQNPDDAPVWTTITQQPAEVPDELNSKVHPSKPSDPDDNQGGSYYPPIAVKPGNTPAPTSAPEVTPVPTATAEATSTPNPTGTPVPTAEPSVAPDPDFINFDDVAATAWYKDAVDYVSAQGLMTGTGNARFSPDRVASRAMLATILYRLEERLGGDLETSGDGGFVDVIDGTWYSDGIKWARSSGIVDGYDGEHFGPDDPLTREQIAAILYRYARYKGEDCAERSEFGGFKDRKSVSDWALEAMSWANGIGLVTGKGDRLAPRDDATRAELAQMLWRFCKDRIGEQK